MSGTPPARPNELLRLAAVTLAFSALAWIKLVRTLLADEKAGLAAVLAGLGLAAVGLAAGVWMRKAVALGYALIAAWAVAGVSAYWAWSFGLNFLWASAGLALASAFFISLGRERPPPTGAPAPAAAGDAECFAQWAKENVEAIVVAFIMALVIRCFCIEVFKIPSSSMEPTLLGDVTRDHARRAPDRDHGGCPFTPAHVKDGGDRIMVTKYYYAFSAIERYDVVVFKFPLNQTRNFIKRVCGLPNEELSIQHGNLFARPAGSARDPQVARRPLRIQDSLWIPLGSGAPFLADRRTFLDAWTPSAPDSFAVEERELRTQQGAAGRSSEFRFRGSLQQEPGTMESGSVPVDDLRIAFDFEIRSPQGSVFAEIENSFGTFEVVLGTHEESRLEWKGAEGGGRDLIEKARLEPDRRYRFEFYVLDGSAQVLLDGVVRAKRDFATVPDEFKAVARPRHGIRFGARELTFHARNLSVGRDIHYRQRPGGNALVTGPDEYIMLGDNVGSSHDSRAWVERVVPLKDGRRIRFEGSEWNNPRDIQAADLQERYGLPEIPDHYVAFDDQGTHWAIYTTPRTWPVPPDRPVVVLDDEQIALASGGGTPYPMVQGKYIVGKALWVWWPPGRWGRLIR